MGVPQREPPAWRLEGLVLRDEGGRCYEVPRVVIERYLVAVAYATAQPEAAGGGAAEAELGVLRATAWRIDGGIYRAEPALPSDVFT